MKNLRKTLLRMAPRRVTRIVSICLAVVALLTAGAVAQRLQVLKATQAEKVHRESQEQIHQTMLVTEAQLHRDIEKITAASTTAVAASSMQQTSFGIVKNLDEMGAQYGVTLVGMAPAASRDVMALEETPFDLEVKGKYQDLASMLLAMPAALPNTAVTHLSATRDEGSADVTMKLRIARYRYKEGKGK